MMDLEGLVVSLDASPWPITRLAIVRCRELEMPDGPPAVGIAQVSAFCSRCAQRRGESHAEYISVNGFRAMVTGISNPCGHVDTPDDLAIEVELQCMGFGCVLLVSETYYPHCSAYCAVTPGAVT